MTGAVRRVAGMMVYVCAADGPPLAGERNAVDLVGDALGGDAGLVAIPVPRLGPGFLTLSTRIAGEVIQKFVNYGLKVAIVPGDATNIKVTVPADLVLAGAIAGTRANTADRKVE